jgi:hypothetical protein
MLELLEFAVRWRLGARRMIPETPAMTIRILVRFCGLFLLFAAITALEAGEIRRSGPQVGSLIPGSFSPYNLNGKRKGSHHCLVCEYALGPVVLVFAKEPAKDKDQALTNLLKKLDKAAEDYRRADLHAVVVFLSPDANSSANDPKLSDPTKLVEEAAARDKLIERLQPRANGLRNVIVGIFPPAGPKGYAINDKAEVTLVFYNRFKVLANAAFGDGEFQQKDAEAFMKTVTDMLAKEKKKPAPKK